MKGPQNGSQRFLEDWIADPEGSRAVVIPKALPGRPFRAHPWPVLSEVAYRTEIVERRRMFLPAPWTGRRELVYLVHVAVSEGRALAASPSRLVETGRPYYDPRMWHPNGLRIRMPV